MSAPTPLLDFFRRGEVARDVRLLAAAGAIAPRAVEQLAILVLLLDDADPEVRTTAHTTINRIPIEPLQAFLARTDVPINVREFFADRGVFPSEVPEIVVDDPLIEADATSDTEEIDDKHRPQSLAAELASMSFPDRMKAAMKGSREVRAILIRDPNKVIAVSVLSSARVNEGEVESFARMANLSEDVLRVIASNRVWMKNYAITCGLARNPKTPIGISLTLLSRLMDRDVSVLSMDRNIPEALRAAARRKVVFGQTRG